MVYVTEDGKLQIDFDWCECKYCMVKGCYQRNTNPSSHKVCNSIELDYGLRVQYLEMHCRILEGVMAQLPKAIELLKLQPLLSCQSDETKAYNMLVAMMDKIRELEWMEEVFWEEKGMKE